MAAGDAALSFSLPEILRIGQALGWCSEIDDRRWGGRWGELKVKSANTSSAVMFGLSARGADTRSVCVVGEEACRRSSRRSEERLHEASSMKREY